MSEGGGPQGDTASSGAAERVRAVAVVRGDVQGVGFRWWVRGHAQSAGLSGAAVNRVDGAVEVVLEGDRSSCEALLARIRAGRTPGRVEQVDVHWSEEAGLRGFDVG